jgi:hypothetical protein
MAIVPDDRASLTIQSSLTAFEDSYGNKYLLKLNTQRIVDDIANIIQKEDLKDEDNSLLKEKLMMAEGNRWLMKRKNKFRDVHFCIVSLRPQHLEEYEWKIKGQLDHLTKQTFTNWNLVNFINDLPEVYKNVSE